MHGYPSSAAQNSSRLCPVNSASPLVHLGIAKHRAHTLQANGGFISIVKINPLLFGQSFQLRENLTLQACDLWILLPFDSPPQAFVSAVKLFKKRTNVRCGNSLPRELSS